MTVRFWKALLILFIFLMGMTACGPKSAVPTSTSPRAAELRSKGQLVVGTAVTAPFEYRDPNTGELIGFDVEVAQAIASYIGVPIVWKEMAFGDLLPALQNGQVDMVIAAMYITPQRQEIVAMSDGYVDTGLVMVTRVDMPQFTSDKDLIGRVVGVKEGATGARYVHRLKDQGYDLIIQEYATTQDSLEDLEKGFVDVALNDKINTLQYIKTHPALKVNGPVLEPAQLGIAVRKEDTELLAIVNEVLSKLRSEGQLDALYRKWISSGP